jgi:hypothetical protein
MALVKQTVLFKMLCEDPEFTHVPVKVFVSPGLEDTERSRPCSLPCKFKKGSVPFRKWWDVADHS